AAGPIAPPDFGKGKKGRGGRGGGRVARGGPIPARCGGLRPGGGERPRAPRGLRPPPNRGGHTPPGRTAATTPSTAFPPAVAGRRARRRLVLPGATTAVIIVATLVGLALRLYQLSRPGYLLGIIEYDDGTDFGSAVRLINGALPYRDFIMVQPPGITLLMAPVALATKAAGTVT